MKTPEEIKKGLFCCSYSDMSCSECPYDGICRTGSGQTPEDDAAALIDHLLTIYSQVSKALCGKENADLEELLQAASQVKKRLAQAERERDAAVKCLEKVYRTLDKNFPSPDDAVYCTRLAKISISDYMTGDWRGVCEENTHDQPSM